MQSTLPEIEENASEKAVAMQLMQHLSGYFVFQPIYVAAKLGIPDQLCQGPKTVEELARAVGAHGPYLYRVLRALEPVGLFTETKPGTFENTPMSKFLCRETPGNLRSLAVMLGEEHYHAWGHLLESVKTGKLAFESVHGMNVFEYFQAHPEASDTFNEAMTWFATNMNKAVLSVYDFSPFRTIIDIGGGHGALIAGILQKTSRSEGVLYDLPHVVEGARETFKAAGVSDRCRIESGDFFQSVPAGGDAYTLSHIIHDWSDERSTQILRNIHQVMNDDGKVLILEDVIQPGKEGGMGKLMDLNMLVMTPGGQERTEAEFNALLAGAGFRLNRILPTPGSVCVIEAVKQ